MIADDASGDEMPDSDEIKAIKAKMTVQMRQGEPLVLSPEEYDLARSYCHHFNEQWGVTVPDTEQIVFSKQRILVDLSGVPDWQI